MIPHPFRAPAAPGLVLALLMVPGLAMPALADVTRLELGDPARRERTAPVVLDAVTDTRTGELLASDELAARLAGIQVLFVGEEHTNVAFHRVQHHVIRALHEAGRDVLVGLEMFPYTRQPELDAWVRGDYGEDEFVEASGWHRHWGYRWAYYADIFRFARDHGLPMIGVNAPREAIKAVRTEGFEALSAEDQAHLPARVDTTSDEHRALFRAYFEEDDPVHMDLSDEQWDGMIRAQATWDAVMGHNAARAVATRNDPNAIIVVLIGAGHVTYGLGAERQIRDSFEAGIASLVPVPAVAADGEPVSVQASYADYVWGVPPQDAPLYPELGVSLAGALGRAPNLVIQVAEGSAAARAGLKTGDLLVRLGDTEILSTTDLHRAMGPLRWGDRTIAELERDDEPLGIEILFRRPSPDRD